MENKQIRLVPYREEPVLVKSDKWFSTEISVERFWYDKKTWTGRTKLVLSETISCKFCNSTNVRHQIVYSSWQYFCQCSGAEKYNNQGTR